jgi:hypothetical protein
VLGDNKRIVTATAQVPRARLEDGPRAARFHVVGYDVSTGTLTAPAVLPSEVDRLPTRRRDVVR